MCGVTGRYDLSCDLLNQRSTLDFLRKVISLISAQLLNQPGNKSPLVGLRRPSHTHFCIFGRATRNDSFVRCLLLSCKLDKAYGA